MLIDNLTLSAGEGTKTINAKIRDEAGNVTTLTSQSVVYDTTAPTVGLTSDVSVISAETGYDEVTFTYTATDTNSLTNYELKLGSTVIKSGSFTNNMTETVTEAEIVAISSGQGSKSFTLDVEDVAGNVGTSSAAVVTVDLTAPTGSVSANTYYNNSTIEVSVSASDTGGAAMSKMKVWLDSTEPNSWEDYASGAYSISSVTEGAHTAHVKFMDSVGNASSTYDSSEFTVDLTAPTGSISTGTYTNSRTITISISASDNLSGVYQMKVWQDGETEPEWESYASSKSITLTGNDGSKTINAKFKDTAGNAMTTATTCSTTLDLDEPDAAITLYKSDNATIEPAKVKVRGFVARISATDTQTTPIVSYKLSGDFTASSTEWQDFAYDSGKTYMSITDLELTTGDGLKTITVQLLDAAGNTSAAVDATVTLDTTPPVIDVSNPDYNKVSKEHTLRLNVSTGAEITGKYNDTCTFTWSANEKLIAFKVCVNEAEQTAEGAETIGTTHGSQNMSGTNVDANTSVTSVIIGADFAATDKVNDTDGAYEVIVYGQDEMGTWSAIHVIE